MEEKVIKKHSFELGEDIIIITEVYDPDNRITHGEPPLVRHKFRLMSHCNTAEISMNNAELNPQVLRQLADELEDILPTS